MKKIRQAVDGKLFDAGKAKPSRDYFPVLGQQ